MVYWFDAGFVREGKEQGKGTRQTDGRLEKEVPSKDSIIRVQWEQKSGERGSWISKFKSEGKENAPKDVKEVYLRTYQRLFRRS